MSLLGRRRTPPPAVTPVDPPSRRGIEMAWRTHGAQEAWTAKVDIKASIVLALATAVLVGVVAGTTKDAAFYSLVGWRHVLLIAAVVADMVAVVLSAVAIWPRLGRSKEHRREHPKHLIYFGHLRHWSSEGLAARLKTVSDDDEREVLAEQLIRMSERNWWKHVALQYALAAILVAVMLVAIVAIVP